MKCMTAQKHLPNFYIFISSTGKMSSVDCSCIALFFKTGKGNEDLYTTVP